MTRNTYSKTCKGCPYIKKEYEDIEIDIEENDDDYKSPQISDACYCEKVGGNIKENGHCADVKKYKEPRYSTNYEMSNKEKHRRRRYYKEKYKKKLKTQSETLRFYPSPAYSVNKDGYYTDDEDEIAYYRKTYKSSHCDRYKYYKRASNKAVRRYFRIVEYWEPFWYHEPWMDEDPEYMELYCDEYGDEYSELYTLNIDSKYGMGNQRGLYKKIFEYWWNVD